MKAFTSIGSEKYCVCSGKFKLNNRVCILSLEICSTLCALVHWSSMTPFVPIYKVFCKFLVHT